MTGAMVSASERTEIGEDITSGQKVDLMVEKGMTRWSCLSYGAYNPTCETQKMAAGVLMLRGGVGLGLQSGWFEV